jgi:hypothetical protein
LITEGFWDLLHAKDREEFTVNQFVFQYVLNYDGFMLFSRPVVKILFVRWETTTLRPSNLDVSLHLSLFMDTFSLFILISFLLHTPTTWT